VVNDFLSEIVAILSVRTISITDLINDPFILPDQLNKFFFVWWRIHLSALTVILTLFEKVYRKSQFVREFFDLSPVPEIVKMERSRPVEA
jgi:hypothetical protein